MSEAHLEIDRLKIGQLVDEYRQGRLVIPEFQREYVWKPKKAPRLLDSIYRGFPISVLLLWTSDALARARRNDPRPARGGNVSWLVDGQQRVITLSRILSGDDGVDVLFHASDDIFRLANAATKRDPNWVRVSDVLDDDAYRDMRRRFPEGKRGVLLEQRYEKLRRALSYEVPAVRMVGHSFDDAVDAFTRINTTGVKLKAVDIESARVAARHTGFIADDVIPFVRKLQNQGFRRLNVMHLFRACAFVALPDGRSRTPLHELSRSEVSSAWTKTKRATERAIALVQNQFGLINMDILWSGALLVPVIAFCAATDVRRRDEEGIAGWLALAALLHRYSGSSETALDEDLKACRADDPVGKLLSNVRRDVGGSYATEKDFRGSLNDKGALLAAYIACRHVGLKDLFSGAKMSLQKNVDRHHILPRAQFPERLRASADTVANIAFVSDAANRAVGAASPDVYLAEFTNAVRESQCIPSNRQLWRIDKANEFWKARRRLLAEAFNDYLRSKLPGRRI